MKFEPLYYGDKLTTINLLGDVAVITLWSKVESVIQVLTKLGIDLSVDTSRIAAVANLYGNGLPQMLRNLLWNPQIRHVVIVGKNLSGSREWLVNFFESGLEEVEFLGTPTFRIRNTTRNIDGGVRSEQFARPPLFSIFGDIGDLDTQKNLKNFIVSLDSPTECVIPRVKPADIPEPIITRFPSEPRNHNILRATPMEAWSELIFRLYRFGYRNTVEKNSGKETRIELLNVKVVVSNPMEESSQELERYGFSLEKFRDYQKRILDPNKQSGLSYTYGHRLREYFQYDGKDVDSLEIVARRLKVKPDSRHEYISLWDNNRDLPFGSNCPCFVSAFFRCFDGKLNLTATFRTHNAMDAWPENLYGLMAIQRFVFERSGIESGPITIFSHSISIDPNSLEKAKKICENKVTDDVVDSNTGKLGPRFDHNGDFVVTFDPQTMELVVEHSFGGMKLGEYRGKTCEEVEDKLARDVSISEFKHALYVGRMLARKEVEMKEAQKKK